MNSYQSLDVSTQKRFRSVNKYGQMVAIFKVANCPLLNTVTISLSQISTETTRRISSKLVLDVSPVGLVVQA